MPNKNKLDDSRTNTLDYKVGGIIGYVVVGCVAACIVAICIALTCRVISWML